MTRVDQEWLEGKLEHLAGRPLAQARLLLCSGDFRLVNEVAEQLLQHNRPLTALATLELYLGPPDGTDKPSAELIVKGLEALVRLPKDHVEQIRAPSSYDIQLLLDYLRSTSVDEDRLATLEWQLLPARGFQEGSPVLERRLARDPAFFLEIMSLCFRRQDGTTEQEIPEGVASNAYRLLKDWK